MGKISDAWRRGKPSVYQRLARDKFNSIRSTEGERYHQQSKLVNSYQTHRRFSRWSSHINHASRCQKLLSNTGIDPLSLFKLIRQSRHQTVSLHRARFVSSQILRHLNLSVAEMSSDLKWQTTLSSTRISKWCYCRNWIVSVFLLSCSFLLQISFGWRFFALLDSAWWLRGRCYQ